MQVDDGDGAAATTSASRESQRAVLHGTLSRFFKHVMPLPEYLARIVPTWSKEYIDQIFHPSYPTSTALQHDLHILAEGLSACGLDELPVFAAPITIKTEDDQHAPPPLQHDLMDDIMRRSQARIVQQEHTFSHNMLTLGYRKADERVAPLSMLGAQGVSNHYVNPYVTRIVMGRQWHTLLAHVGEQVMEHLLTSTALFIPLGGGIGKQEPALLNMTQVLGLSIGEAVPLPLQPAEIKVQPSDSAKRKRKRRPRAKKRIKHDEDEDDEYKYKHEPTDKERLALLTPAPPSFPFVKRTPAQIDLLHNRIFYGKPTRSRAGALIYGLPSYDILNRSADALQDHSASTKSNSRATMERARKVSQYIWPREFGLKNVFSVPAQRKESEYEARVSLGMRDAAIQAHASLPTPDRLRHVQRLVAIMLRKHDKLNYRRALTLCCPSALPKRTLTESERKGIVEDLCEVQAATQAAPSSIAAEQQTQQTVSVDSLQFETQAFSMVDNKDVHEQNMATPSLSSKSQFTKYRAPQGCVARFVRLIVRQLVPKELFGSVHNTNVVMKAIDRFVTLRRYESMTLHEVLQGFRILDCTWLLPQSKRALWQRPTRDEMAKRQRILHEFLFWLFDTVVVSLLRNSFYATESAKFRNRVLYFRHDDWLTITQPILDTLKEACFERVAKHKAVSIMSQRSFGYSFVRLLPKEVGMRPIVNLRRHSTKIDRNKALQAKYATPAQRKKLAAKRKSDGWGQVVRQKHSINSTLRATFQVLNYEKHAHPNDIGSSVFGADDMFARLSHFKRRLRRRDGTLPPLYFVKMDVAGAFDCIDQDRLLKIVNGIIRHDRYIVQHYTKITTSRTGKQYKLWPRLACPEVDQGSFDELAEHLAAMQVWRNTIVADGVTYAHSDRTALMGLLREHVSNNLIKVGKDFCRQRVGIPQGSTLSTLLCCYYLARMESELCLSPARNDANSMLMRWTDDFLFISTDMEAARRFFVSVQNGSTDFNCVLSPSKSQCNFNLVTSTMSDGMADVAAAVRFTSTQYMPWCSYRIDMHTLAVRYDMERYRWASMSDTLTIPMRSAFARAVPRAYTFTVQQRTSPIYLDVALNTLDGVLINVYQAFVVSTIRMLATFIAAKRRYGTTPATAVATNKAKTNELQSDEARRTTALLLRCITSGIDTCYAGASAKMLRAKAKAKARGDDCNGGDGDEPWPVTAHTYRWLALHATHAVLSLRPSTRSMAVTEIVERQSKRTQRHLYARMPQLHQVARKAWQDVRSVAHSMTIK